MIVMCKCKYIVVSGKCISLGAFSAISSESSGKYYPPFCSLSLAVCVCMCVHVYLCVSVSVCVCVCLCVALHRLASPVSTSSHKLTIKPQSYQL